MIKEDIQAGDLKKQELLFQKEEMETCIEAMTEEYGCDILEQVMELKEQRKKKQNLNQTEMESPEDSFYYMIVSKQQSRLL